VSFEGMKVIATILVLSLALSLQAQERVTTFGVQYKPIIPSNLFRAGQTAVTQSGIDYELNQQLGYSFGGALRFGMTKWLSLESGISFVRRNFTTTVADVESSFYDTVGFRVVGYEIPITGMVFVRLADRVYMNSAFGLALDMFPSDVGNGNSNDFYQVSRRRGFGNEQSFMTWSKLALVANIGFELRTESSGYFYIGGSYHRPFRTIYDTHLFYTNSAGTEHRTMLQMSGNYLTLDLRYFFHEEPKEKKVERDPETMPSWMKK
jgi:hypothetical protein